MSKEIEFLKESNKIEKGYSQEALEDAIEAWEYAKVMIPLGRKIDIQYIKTIHMFLMKRIDSRIAGQLRKVPVYVGGRECLNYEKINTSLFDWCKKINIRFMNSPKDIAMDGIEKIHVAFEEIHPFEDGNGRVGRILMNIQRLRSYMDILIIKEKEKFKYYKWFKDSK